MLSFTLPASSRKILKGFTTLSPTGLLTGDLPNIYFWKHNFKKFKYKDISTHEIDLPTYIKESLIYKHDYSHYPAVVFDPSNVADETKFKSKNANKVTKSIDSLSVFRVQSSLPDLSLFSEEDLLIESNKSSFSIQDPVEQTDKPQLLDVEENVDNRRGSKFRTTKYEESVFEEGK